MLARVTILILAKHGNVVGLRVQNGCRDDKRVSRQEDMRVVGRKLG